MNYLSFLLTLTLLLYAFTSANATSLQIKSKGSADPIIDASVINLNTNEFSASDEQGRTDIHFSPGDKIKILAPGFETLIEDFQSQHEFFLEPINYATQGLIVYGERVKEKSSKIILSAEELKQAPGSRGDPLLTIRSLPGVASFGSQLNVRGSGSGSNNVWVNGFTLEYLYHLFDQIGSPSTINPDLVSDFNVFLAGFPVEYPDGLGGMFDVKLRDPKTNRFHKNLRLGMNETAFLFEGPLTKKTSFYATARHSNLDLIFTPETIAKLAGETENLVISLPNYYDAQALLHHKLNNGSLDLQFFAAGDNVTAEINNAGKRNPQINGLFDIDMHYQTLGLNWQQKLNPKLRAQTIFEVRHVRQKQQIGADQNGPLYSKATEYRATWHPQLTWFSSRQNEYRFGSEIAYARFPVDLNNKAAGVAGEYTPRTLRETIALKDTLHAIGATPYIKQRRQWTQQLTTIIGLRYSKIRASDGVDLNDFSPRASVEYQTLLGPLLTASWGRYVQMPGEIQLLPDYGNPYLTFNRAEHRVLGLQQKLNPNWHLQVEAYHKPMNNLVVHNTTLTPRYLNQGEGEAYGFDILLKRRQSNGRMGWLAYSFSHSQRTHLLTQTTSTFSGDIPHNLTLIWGQPLPGTWQRWQWGFKFNIRSGRAYTPVIAADKYCYSEVLAGDPDPKCDDQSIDPANEDVFLVPTYAKPANQTRMPIYYKLDVRIEREIRFNTWRLKLYADIQNLTARENVVAFNYGQYFENINNPKAIKNPGIAFPFLGLEAIF